MKVHANIWQEVDVDPQRVVDKLLQEVCYRGGVFEKNGKYFITFEVSGGHNGYEETEEITKEKYDYILALETVSEYLSKDED